MQDGFYIFSDVTPGVMVVVVVVSITCMGFVEDDP